MLARSSVDSLFSLARLSRMLAKRPDFHSGILFTLTGSGTILGLGEGSVQEFLSTVVRGERHQGVLVAQTHSSRIAFGCGST